MSSTEKDVEIDLEKLEAEDAAADAAKKKKGDEGKAPEAEKKATVVKPDEGLEKLRKQLADERAARAKAENDAASANSRAREANESEDKARVESHENKLALITNAINAKKSANEALKARYKEARTNNDLDEEFKIQEELATNSTQLQLLEQGKTALESAAKATPARREQPKEDIVERFARDLTEPSAAWVRSHPAYIRDPKKNAAMIGAHNIAMEKDIPVDTPEYFKFIEDTLGIRKNGKADEPEPPKKTDEEDPMKDAASNPVERDDAPASAPVSRKGGSGDETDSRIMRLKPDEVEAARMSGMTNEEYAKQKALLIKEGKLTRTH